MILSVTWLIHMWHAWVRPHDSFICDMPEYVHMTHSYVTCLNVICMNDMSCDDIDARVHAIRIAYNTYYIQYVLHTIRIAYNTYCIQYVLHTIRIAYNTYCIQYVCRVIRITCDDVYKHVMYHSWISHLDVHTATHCNTLQHSATLCNTLQHTVTHMIISMNVSCHTHEYVIWKYTLQHTATLQHAATHCNTYDHIYERVMSHTWKSHLDVLTATHCNTLQHTTTHCNTLQHIWWYV